MWNNHALLFISCHSVSHPLDARVAWQAVDLDNIDWRCALLLLSAVVLLIGFICLPGTSSGSSLLVPYVEGLIFVLVFI